MMFILLTWCEFQKYALTSLQQLLADHPPAPEGLDPDIGTVVNKHLCLFCFFVCLFVCCFLSLLEARKASISPITSRSYLQKHYIYIYIFFWGVKLSNAQFGNNTQLVQWFVRGDYFSLRGCEKKHGGSHRG